MTELPTGTITFLFSDIEGSTRLLRELRNRYAELMADHQRLLRQVFEEHLLSQATFALLEDEEEELAGLSLRDLDEHVLKDFDRPVGSTSWLFPTFRLSFHRYGPPMSRRRSGAEKAIWWRPSRRLSPFRFFADIAARSSSPQRF